jgi:hypothetical protein
MRPNLFCNVSTLLVTCKYLSDLILLDRFLFQLINQSKRKKNNVDREKFFDWSSIRIWSFRLRKNDRN